MISEPWTIYKMSYRLKLWRACFPFFLSSNLPSFFARLPFSTALLFTFARVQSSHSASFFLFLRANIVIDRSHVNRAPRFLSLFVAMRLRARSKKLFELDKSPPLGVFDRQAARTGLLLSAHASRCRNVYSQFSPESLREWVN